MPLIALRRLSVYTLFLAIGSMGLVACGGSDSPEPPPAASSSTGGDASSSADESSSNSSTASSVSSSTESNASSSSDASSSSSEPLPDQTPDAFTFDAQSNVSLGATVTSNTITIEGIDAETAISIVGGQYAVNGGDFTSNSGSVENSDKVLVQVTASADFAVESSATLTVGGVDGTFTVTTVEKDTMPDGLDFTPSQDMQPGEAATSNTVTVTGINVPVSVEVTGGSYSINEGEFTAETGELTEGDTLTLKGVSPEEAGATQEVTVTVGGVAGVWALTTREDIEPPEAAFVFPTPMTATEGDTVIVRGTASDELSTVTGVTLQVSNDSGTTDLSLESENDFATWQKQVPLAEGENTITLSAEDEAGNVLTDGDSVTVVRQDLELAFPDEELPIGDPKKLVYDEERERVLFANLADTLIYAVDINTGKRSAFFTKEMASELIDPNASGLELVPGGEKVLLLLNSVNQEGPGVLRIDLDTKEYEVVLTRDSQPDNQPNFTKPSSLRLDPMNPERAIALDSLGVNAKVLSLNLATGGRTLVSNNDADFSGPQMYQPNDLLIDADNSRALVADNYGGREVLYWVDLETGDRTIFLTEGEPDGTPEFHMASMTTDDIGERIYGTESHSWALWSVDTKTGEYKVISDESTPNNYNPVVRLSGVSLSSDGEYLIGVDQDLGPAVYVIDLKTGERLFISKNSGPDNFSR